jgi:glycosyltransferase involved in cell wall biosynthesis
MPASTARRGAASLDEGLPLSLVEATVARRPIVATDSARELVDDGETGLPVRPTDADALAGAIRRLASDSGLAEGLGSAGPDCAIADFSSGAMVSAVSRQYRELLDG